MELRFNITPPMEPFPQSRTTDYPLSSNIIH